MITRRIVLRSCRNIRYLQRKTLPADRPCCRLKAGGRHDILIIVMQPVQPDRGAAAEDTVMDYAEERRFVRSFIRESRRDRLLFELTTPKKRSAGAGRFCHQAEEFLDPSAIMLKGPDLERQPEFR